MKNRTYLRSILGGSDFRSLSLIEKIRYINAVLLWLRKHHANLILRDKLDFNVSKQKEYLLLVDYQYYTL